ncbi:MAG TPA: hypothetical protein VNN25_04290, partial [Thermoanaerobaculia bacterium]|nr:hypothetical protein [Thermoanaerobaculia bacterium]
MNPNQETINPSAAADLQQAAPTLSPEGVVDQLRATRAQIGEMTPLTVAQRKALHGRIRTSNPILQASINVIGAHDIVAKAIGQPADDMRLLCDETNRWTAVE